MLIDWFTVVAQGLNFLVLVWLLKRYLYKPVLAAIDAREKHIALAIAAAASQGKAAEQERAALAAKMAALEAESAVLLEKAASAATAERARLLADAHTEADALRAKQMNALRDDQRRLRQGIARSAQQEVLAIARKVLGDLAGASLEERVAAVFVQRLDTLDGTAKGTLVAAFAGASAAVVRSAFGLTEAQRALIQNRVEMEFAASVVLRFEVATEMLCGVELLVGGQKLAWSVADYLDGLEQKVAYLDAASRAPNRTISSVKAAAVSTS